MARGELSLDQPNPSYLDTITFTVVVPDGAEAPALAVNCYQDGVLVWGASSYPLQTTFVLGPSRLWTGGPAEGVADLHDRGSDGSRHKPLARTVKFHVEG